MRSKIQITITEVRPGQFEVTRHWDRRKATFAKKHSNATIKSFVNNIVSEWLTPTVSVPYSEDEHGDIAKELGV